MHKFGTVGNRASGFAAVLVMCLLILSSFAAVSNLLIAAEPQADEMVFHPMSIARPAASYGFSGYSVDQIRTAYGLPSTGGANKTIAIIIAYDTPTIKEDLRQFSLANNLPEPTDQNFEVHKMSSTISVDSGWSQEACLDVEWAHAIAPEAKILLVESQNAISGNLLKAVEYATSRTDVSVVSMSWGTAEVPTETLNDDYFKVPDVAFFAASGDEGSVVMYPSSSPYVVAVGGTTLNLDSAGNVLSETAWSKSGGGISQYEKIPAYQSSYGLNSPYRCVPDISYNADASTGFGVYYKGQWYVVGGTSAGSPQWAAIYALGASAKLSNLYEKAKTSYATYFRDIISGATSKYSATANYDYVTGLGSPLSSNFEDYLTTSPSSGGPGTNITLTMTGLTGPTASVSYLNPITQKWVPLNNSVPVTYGNTTVYVTAPDLMQANPSGDSAQTFDSIVLRATEANGKSYNTSTPFNLNRRGLTQVSTAAANGVFGTSTDLTGRVFVKGGDVLPISGVWFNPGSASVLLDNAYIGNAVVDQTGTLSASITVPTSVPGQHTLTIQDFTTAFTVNIAYMPTLTTDYANTEMWHQSDFTININPDSPVNETYYRINGGAVQNLTANGQPVISSEGANNTLEYWSAWSPNASKLLETAHTLITGIKLDKTPPDGSVSANSVTELKTITLNLLATDNVSGVTSMRFSNDNSSWSTWETYGTTKSWSLDGGDGVKTVYVQFQNAAGLVSAANTTVTLLTPTPTPTATPKPTPVITAAPTPTATNMPTDEPFVEPTGNPSASVPELTLIAAISAIAGASLLLLLIVKRRSKR